MIELKEYDNEDLVIEECMKNFD
jgi:hypothetical protein